MGDLDLLCQAARASGDIATGFFKADPKVWHKADDAGPVTEADLAVNTYLQTYLQSERPHYGWLSEESDDQPERHKAASVFIIDPIDGTRAFIEGSSHWSHSLAIAQNGIVEAAAVYLPVTDLLYSAQRGKGAFLNGTPIQVCEREEIQGANILANKANFKEDCWPGGFPGIKRSFRSSLAYRLCLVADGSFDGMLTLRPTWEWDVAAGCLIVEEAGGLATTRAAAPLTFNSKSAKLDGIVASNAPIHRGLIKGLT